MNSFLTSLIRTWVPIGIGAFISWLATNYDIIVPADASSSLVVGVVALVTAVYYVLARAVEKAYPWLGQLLVGLGVGKAPEYPPTVPEAVRTVRGY